MHSSTRNPNTVCRDGKLLRLVPTNERLTPDEMRQCLISLLNVKLQMHKDVIAELQHLSEQKVAQHEPTCLCHSERTVTNIK